jgi:hypothetical protein
MLSSQVMLKIVNPTNFYRIKKFILHFSYTIWIESWRGWSKLKQEHLGFRKYNACGN